MAIISSGPFGSLWRWFGRVVTLRGDGARLDDGNSESGETVTDESALQLSAVWSCVRLLAETGGSLPCEVYRVGADGVAIKDPLEPLSIVLHDSPNADMTALSFWEVVIASIALWGTAFAEKQRNGQGALIGLVPLLPANTRIEKDSAGVRLIYADPTTGRERTIARDDAFIVPGFGTTGLVGFSTLAYARNSLGSAQSVERSSARWFRNGMRPATGLVVPKDITLSKEQRESLRNDIAARTAGAANAGRFIVLEGGIEPKTLGMPPEDSQMLQTRSFGVEEICRWFRVPPPLIGHTAAGTGWPASQEQQNSFFLTYSLRPYLKRIEQQITRSLIPPALRGKLYAKFNIDALLRADSAARGAYYATMSQNGLMTRNEIRSKENLSNMDGGDVLTVQSNLIPIDLLGKVPPAGQQRRATDQPTAEPIKQ